MYDVWGSIFFLDRSHRPSKVLSGVLGWRRNTKSVSVHSTWITKVVCFIPFSLPPSEGPNPMFFWSTPSRSSQRSTHPSLIKGSRIGRSGQIGPCHRDGQVDHSDLGARLRISVRRKFYKTLLPRLFCLVLDALCWYRIH